MAQGSFGYRSTSEDQMTRLHILDRLQAKSLNYRRMDDFLSPDFFTMECQKTGQIHSLDSRTEEWSFGPLGNNLPVRKKLRSRR